MSYVVGVDAAAVVVEGVEANAARDGLPELIDTARVGVVVGAAGDEIEGGVVAAVLLVTGNGGDVRIVE